MCRTSELHLVITYYILLFTQNFEIMKLFKRNAAGSVEFSDFVYQGPNHENNLTIEEFLIKAEI